MEYGFQGKQLNFEFIQELDVKTGGYEAEYGRATGGIINVITKSGGNEFHGDVFAYYDNDSLQSKRRVGRVQRRHGAGFTKKDYGLDLGGYIVKDKLWFFGAYDQVKNTTQRRSSSPLGPMQVKSTPVREHARPRLREADLASRPEPVAGRHVLPGPAHRHRRDQRRRPHPQRRSAHLRGPEGVRRPRLRAALRRDLRCELGRLGPGRPPRGEAQHRARECCRRRHPVPGRGQQLLPDRRLRPDRGQGVHAGLLRCFPEPLPLAATRSSSARSTRRKGLTSPSATPAGSRWRSTPTRSTPASRSTATTTGPRPMQPWTTRRSRPCPGHPGTGTRRSTCRTGGPSPPRSPSTWGFGGTGRRSSTPRG